MKTLILIDKKNRKIKKLLKNYPNSLIVSLNPDIDNYLLNQNIKYKSMQDYTSYFGDIQKNSVLWLKNWANKRIEMHKNIKELFKYEDFSLWWLMEDWLYTSYIYYDPLRTILIFTREINIIIQKEKPKRLMLVSNDPLYHKIIRKIAKRYRIYYKRLEINISFYKTIKLYFKKIAVNKYIKAVYFTRGLYWKFLKYINNFRNQEPNNNQNKILFFSNGPYTKCITLKNETRNGDPYLINIIDELIKNKRNYIQTIDETENFQFKLAIQVLKDEINDKIMNYEILENYRTRRINKKVKKLNSFYKNKWKNLKKIRGFKKSFQYQGINIWDLIEPQFSCYFSARLYGHLLDLELVKELVKTENPRIVVFPSETSGFAKLLFYFCRKKNIKTIAIQHGPFGEGATRCTHLKTEISSIDKLQPRYCPLPDAVIVFGPYYKDYLIKKGYYQEKKIYPLGFQKTDLLVHSKKLFNKESICKELKLDPNKKIITIATLHFPGGGIRKKILDITVSAIKKMKNIQLVVKMHPFENDNKTYETIIKEKKLQKWLILRKIDIHKILFISDIIITTISTSGIEAIVLNKPLITINVTGMPFPIPYKEYGASIEISNEKELLRSINDIFYNKKVNKILEKGRRKFIKDYNYKNDGKASYRIAKLIEKMAST